ncbi:MAG TPA: MgtC/SapB family protein [Clostridia bacterium]|nr:MgtC/SapB family protein [Clostridia bacterium]
MGETLQMLRQFNMPAVVLRLTLAMLFGGMLGIERTQKGRAAGFRTYMFVCMGATLTILLGQYESALLMGKWADMAKQTGVGVDVSRFGAQVVNGVGFLGAGTIVVTGKQEIQGLTTAAGLWASACMGLAIGAGAYECVVLAFVLIFLCIRVFPHLETNIMARTRYMNIYVEFRFMDDVGEIINRIKLQEAKIYEVDINRGDKGYIQHSAVFFIRLNKRRSHKQVLAAISEFENVTTIDEI